MNATTSCPEAPPRQRVPFYRQLYVHVLAAILIGVLLGHFAPTLAVQMKPLGDAFIKLVKMVIGPIIFCTVVTGIAGMGDMKKVGRVGGKALLYFEVVSTLSLMIGLLAGHLLRPGAGFNLDPSKIDASALSGYATQAHEQSTVEFLMHIIPNTVVDAFVTGNVLQVLLVSVLFGAALAALGERGKPLVEFIGGIANTFFGIVHIIMKIAADRGLRCDRLHHRNLWRRVRVAAHQADRRVLPDALCICCGRARRDRARDGVQHLSLHELYPRGDSDCSRHEFVRSGAAAGCSKSSNASAAPSRWSGLSCPQAIRSISMAPTSI